MWANLPADFLDLSQILCIFSNYFTINTNNFMTSLTDEKNEQLATP